MDINTPAKPPTRPEPNPMEDRGSLDAPPTGLHRIPVPDRPSPLGRGGFEEGRRKLEVRASAMAAARFRA